MAGSPLTEPEIRRKAAEHFSSAIAAGVEILDGYPELTWGGHQRYMTGSENKSWVVFLHYKRTKLTLDGPDPEALEFPKIPGVPLARAESAIRLFVAARILPHVAGSLEIVERVPASLRRKHRGLLDEPAGDYCLARLNLGPMGECREVFVSKKTGRVVDVPSRAEAGSL